MWTPRQKIRVDEDCCILSADPLAANKAPPVVFPAAADDDDFVVLAERGQVRTPPRDSSFPPLALFLPRMSSDWRDFDLWLQVACRDFPHARHACAKYPFASTPHHSHCEQVPFHNAPFLLVLFCRVQSYHTSDKHTFQSENGHHICNAALALAC
jgi:hypothetical protein